MQPGVAQGKADLLEHVEDEAQFFVGEGLAGQALVEDSHAEKAFAVEDGNGDLRPEKLKFLGNLAVRSGFAATGAQDAAMPVKRCPPMPAPRRAAKCCRTL